MLDKPRRIRERSKEKRAFDRASTSLKPPPEPSPKRATVPLELPILVAKLAPQKPGRPRKVPGLSVQLARWLELHENTDDIHQALRELFRVTVPRWGIALSLKAEQGDPVALKLALEWWKTWKAEDVARTLNVTPSAKSSQSWVSASLDPDASLGINNAVTNVTEGANTPTSSDGVPDNGAVISEGSQVVEE